MATGYVLYNPQAGHDNSKEDLQLLELVFQEELVFIDVHDMKDYRVFIQGLAAEDFLVLAGGDGTLNHFANAIDGIAFDNEILYYPSGTGNDFAYDLGYERECAPFSAGRYLKNLPSVQVSGKTYRFVNGVGYGIDGYCCQEGDKRKALGKKVNYTAIAIKGLLFHYKPTAATVTVDGVSHSYDRVWLAPTMNGRCYGGGMMPAPHQDRLGEERTLSTLVFHGSGKLKTLLMFPSLFKGEHLRYIKHAEVLTGHTVTVAFDRPVALQIDGETIPNVTAYTACSPAVERVAV
ncbi:MAG: diacylglycerol kinase family protein [Clostridia bacterium]|nr:diacylglycerol kinase family protein [Clostridia bacterium]